MKLIFLEGEYYLIQEGNPKLGDWYIGFAHGIKGVGKGFYLKHYKDSNPASKLSAISSGNHKILASTAIIEGVEYLLDREQVEDQIVHYIPLKSEIKGRETLKAKIAAVDFASKNHKVETPLYKGKLEGFMAGYKFADSDKEFTYGDMLKAIEFGRQLPPLKYEMGGEYNEEIDFFIDSLYKEKVVLYVRDIIKNQKYIYIDSFKMPVE